MMKLKLGQVFRYKEQDQIYYSSHTHSMGSSSYFTRDSSISFTHTHGKLRRGSQHFNFGVKYVIEKFYQPNSKILLRECNNDNPYENYIETDYVEVLDLVNKEWLILDSIETFKSMKKLEETRKDLTKELMSVIMDKYE